MSIQRITMKELHNKLGHLGEGEVILDVRSTEEYHSGHVPGSMNIPYDQVADHVDELKEYKCIYVHCKMGGRAAVAVDVLSKLGLKNLVSISTSGMADWMSAGFPIEK